MAEASVVRTRSGADLFVRDWGAGPPVLLLAGWGMTSDLWGAVMLRLNAAGLRAVSFDRRGHGRSSDPGTLDYDLLADDLHEVMEALGLAGCTLVAHSGAGGEVVRCIARHGDARIARIVLVGATLPAPMRTDDNPEGADPALFEAVAGQIADDLPAWIDANARPYVAPETSTRSRRLARSDGDGLRTARPCRLLSRGRPHRLPGRAEASGGAHHGHPGNA